MKYAYYFLLAIGVVFILSFTCCKNNGCHDEIKIINNSGKTIYFYGSYMYPDTTIPDYDPSVAGAYYKVEKYSTNRHQIRGCFDAYLLDSSKIMYFIFDKQILESTPWDTVVKKYLILKRYDLGLQDLERNNWTINVP